MTFTPCRSYPARAADPDAKTRGVARTRRWTHAGPLLPTGTVTFLLSDIEDSSMLWDNYPHQMRTALARHDTLIETLVSAYLGVVVRPRGEGDSRFAVFTRPTDAVAAACAIQLALRAEPWPLPSPLSVRLALHIGETDVRDGDYYGTAVNRCARIRGLAHGGQILLSELTTKLVGRACRPKRTGCAGHLRAARPRTCGTSLPARSPRPAG